MSKNAIVNRLRNVSKNGEEEKDIPKVDFVYKGDKLIIPEDMSLEEAREAIDRQIIEESVMVKINELVRAFPLDGAVALMRVLERRYGWTHLVSKKTMFGPEPPAMIGVETGPKPEDRIQVPWGLMQVPKIEGKISTGYDFDRGMPLFQLGGEIRRVDERTLASIAAEVREEVVKNSIYRGKAIKINFRDPDGERIEFDASLAPKFIDLTSEVETNPIFSKSIEDAIRVNILNPIRLTSQFKSQSIPLKTGVLLGGPYGTGKTATAFQIARACVENNWTFLYLEDVRDLDLAINFAKLYQPCVLFAEDVDKAVSGQRTAELDRILNTIDGIESKGNEALITVLTTNNLSSIHRSFIRPGRIDTVIEVLPPDAEAALRIIKMYAESANCQLDGNDEDFCASLQCLIGANAAFFRTTLEAAKKSALECFNGKGKLTITPVDLKIAATAMVPHCKLINPDHGIVSLMSSEGEVSNAFDTVVETVVDKFAEGFIGQITNPNTLSKIVRKVNNKNSAGSNLN